MRNKLQKKLFLSITMVSLLMMPINIHAQSETSEGSDELPTYEDFEFHTVNMDGTIDTVYVEDGHRENEPFNPLLKGVGGITMFNEPRNLINGVVNFKTKPRDVNTLYVEEESKRAGYTNGCYGADAAYLGMVGDKVRFMQSGVIGLVDASEVEILNYDDTSAVRSVNFYRVEQGRIRHYITTDLTDSNYSSSLDIGPKQEYMANNTVYYSYDGHYFYETFEWMISDYKNDTRSNSINPNNPYYNYYQFLSQRTKTNISADGFDVTTIDTATGYSKMENTGSAFINAQNKYGANALLNYSLAANESNWGNSSIALNKNNLFGHAAYDSNPNNASAYDSPVDCINAHAKTFVSINYMDPKDYYDSYNGPHFGDKQNGFNVKYASDPYWGEKMAAIAYAVDRATGGHDVGRYKIGMVEASSVMVRSEASQSSYALYETRNPGKVPVLILGEVEGSSVNGNTKWYKIQSDPTLNDDRTAMTQDEGTYDYSVDYGYISAEYVTIANEVTIPEDAYKKGDVNGDGTVNAKDLLKVEKHIVFKGNFTLSGSASIAADVNDDGEINSKDLLKIEKHVVFNTAL